MSVRMDEWMNMGSIPLSVQSILFTMDKRYGYEFPGVCRRDEGWQDLTGIRGTLRLKNSCKAIWVL